MASIQTQFRVFSQQYTWKKAWTPWLWSINLVQACQRRNVSQLPFGISYGLDVKTTAQELIIEQHWKK